MSIIIKGRSPLAMAALSGALAVAMASAAPVGYTSDYVPRSKHRDRKAANRPAGSKLARKAAKGKL